MQFDFLATMPAEQYHADPCETPSLSSSLARTLIDRSPQRAYREHPRLGGERRVETSEMKRGDVIHSVVLGQTLDHIEVLEFADFRTKAAQTARRDAEAAGKTAVLADDMGEWMAIAASVRDSIAAFGIDFDGQSEGVALWQDRDRDGLSVQCRSMLDHVTTCDGWLNIYDLKTTEDANPRNLVRKMSQFGYDIQCPAYIRAIETLAPEWQGRVKFMFLFVEMEPPYPVTPIVLDGGFMAIGRSKWQRAVNLWSECLRSNNWPPYATAPVTLSPTGWQLHDEISQSPRSATTLSTYLD